MFLFKTSGATFESVIRNQKHAFRGKPSNWHRGEMILVSKNKRDCVAREKQISYVMRFKDVRLIRPGEAEKYWPGNEGRWKYLVICEGSIKLPRPFNLEDIIGRKASEKYKPVITSKKLDSIHEKLVIEHLAKQGVSKKAKTDSPLIDTPEMPPDKVLGLLERLHGLLKSEKMGSGQVK